jgi:hypothetical protein
MPVRVVMAGFSRPTVSLAHAGAVEAPEIWTDRVAAPCNPDPAVVAGPFDPSIRSALGNVLERPRNATRTDSPSTPRRVICISDIGMAQRSHTPGAS